MDTRLVDGMVVITMPLKELADLCNSDAAEAFDFLNDVASETGWWCENGTHLLATADEAKSCECEGGA